MKHLKYFTLAAVCLFGTACDSQKQVAGGSGNTSADTGAANLEAILSIPAKSISRDSVMLTFTVVNNSNTESKFCKWETAFEPKLGKYFEINEETKGEAQFHGAMARRVMPPPSDAYIKVPAHDSVSTAINLAKTYSLNSGKYKIVYTGAGVSGLIKSNPVETLIP